MIEADGSTSTHRVFSAHPSDEFAGYAVAWVEQWQYQPAPEFEPVEPVYTEMTLTLHQGRRQPSEQAYRSLKAKCGSDRLE